ncbi:MAG: GHKL domain-containing protein, partial [Methylococcales bacterium]|nr:GHKL domain-containing protein [Methylococcales bacterium]
SSLGTSLPKPTSLSTGKKTFEKISVADSEFYTTAYGVSWPTDTDSMALTFSITTDLSSFDKQINSYRITLWAWLIAMALLLLLSQAAILRWGLAPLRKVGAELNRIEAGKQQQIENHYPQEIERLTHNINILLEHERQQKTRYRDAMGNLAHSLKTPLAILQTSLQTDLHEQDKKLMQEQLSRMNSIVEYQLQRAVTAGSAGLGKSVELLPTIKRLLNSLQKVYSDKAINVTTHIDSALIFRGDEGDLMEVLGNLLDNAFKWAHQNIEISAQQSGKQLLIVIDDDGSGIAQEKAEKLLQRGVRADQTTAGHGIGLSIVKSIAHAYGGNLSISKSDLGGAKVRVLL